MKHISRRLLPSVLFVFIVFALWQIIEDRVNQQRFEEGKTSLHFFIPTPLDILEAAQEDADSIGRALVQTLQKAMFGFALGALLAFAVALIYQIMPFVRMTTLPVAYAIQSFPIVGIAPAIVLAFGQDSFLSIVAVSAILTYFPILLTLDDGFHQVSQEFLEIGELHNASKLQMVVYIKLPIVLPRFFTSLKLAAPVSIVGATIGEWIGSSSGIGRLITLALYQLKPGTLYACLFALALVSASTVLIVSLVQRIVFPWMELTKPANRQ